MCERDKQTATENIRCYVLIVSEKNTEKPERGVEGKTQRDLRGELASTPSPVCTSEG